jgi:type IV pilus assembly protein PilN
MRNFEASPWLEDPKLVEIKAVKLGNATINEFNLNVKVSRPKEEPADQVPAKPAPGGATHPKQG